MTASGRGARRHPGRRPQGSRARERERLLEACRAAEPPSACDVCVVGGGAAGLVACVAAAEAGASVTCLEAAPEAGRTILATGNGRCNLANRDLSPRHYTHPDLVSRVMGADATERVLRLFSECGLACVEEEGRLYPRSLQAASVRDVLLARARRSGALLACARRALSAARVGDAWRVSFRAEWEGGGERSLSCRSLVVATGGVHRLPFEAEAGGRRLPLVGPEPVLCPLTCEADPSCEPRRAPYLLARLDGRRARCEATLLRAGEPVAREAGEVLFRPWGISGIASLDLSRHAAAGDLVSLDLVPELREDEVARRLGALGADRRDLEAALAGLLDPEVARALLEVAAEPGRLAALAKGLALRVVGLAAPERAQVMRGGVEVGALDADTLEVRGMPRLHACGEAVDVDGACGGYNLSWAWLSGLRAGAAAARGAG